jgi:hypothetical protein
MSRTTSAANGGGIAAELRNWARGCHSTEAAAELLIRARGGRFVEPGQPWLRTDDRGITWLDAEVIARYADAVSSGERHILALIAALALGKPLERCGPSHGQLGPLPPRSGPCRVAACRLWQRVDTYFLKRRCGRVLVMAEWSPVAIRKMQTGLVPRQRACRNRRRSGRRHAASTVRRVTTVSIDL